MIVTQDICPGLLYMLCVSELKTNGNTYWQTGQQILLVQTNIMFKTFENCIEKKDRQQARYFLNFSTNKHIELNFLI